MIPKISFIYTLLSLLIFNLIQGQAINPDHEKIDSLFSEWDRKESPGCAIGIVKNGDLVYGKGYGIADLEHDIPIDENSVFYAASVSKHFITTCILLLEEQGKLGLDDEIQKFLPDFPRYEAPHTIRNFIHHTSGVRDYLTLWSLAGNDYADKVDRNAAYELIKRQKTLNFTPGEKYLYSNSCYLILAMIIEKASGMRVDDYTQKHIFEPLKMSNSHFHDNVYHLIKNRVFSYSPVDDTYKNLILRFDLVGSGGLYTTVSDLAKWDKNFYDNQIGLKSPDLLNKIHEDGLLNNGESAGYAFGLHNAMYRGLPTVGHGGALAGYRTYFLRFPEQSTSIIILANISNFKSKTMALKLADIVLKESFKETLPPDTDSGLKETTEPITYQAKNLSSYEGDYYSGELEITYQLRVIDHTLTLKIGYNDPMELQPIGEDMFSDRFKVRFHRNEYKDITGLSVDAGRVQNLHFIRVNQ